jgi:gentisate 1,2-dioxygenase
MTTTLGQVFAYSAYRDHFDARPAAPVVWSWATVLGQLAAASHGERGSLTLSSTGDGSGCELLPGIAINVQVVEAGGTTRTHAHSWWHLFLVQSGQATSVLGDSESRSCIRQGDLLLVPAWCDHRFENDGLDSLVVLSMSNLPQQTGLSNQRAREPQGSETTNSENHQ